MPTTAELAAALLQVIEGCKLQSYRDSGGIWTVGIGHTAGVTPAMVITPQQAAAFFQADQAQLLTMVVGRPLLEAAALISFGFNAGPGALRGYLAGTLQLSDRVRDRNGNVLAGLVARRRLEQMLIDISKGTPASA